MRKIALVVGAVSALVVPAGSAFATEIHTPAVGRWGCGVESATIGVAEPGEPTVTVEGVAVDVNHCLPPV